MLKKMLGNFVKFWDNVKECKGRARTYKENVEACGINVENGA
jgi:hypothetical protein